MKVTEKLDQIIVYDDVYESGYCEHVIKQFDLIEEAGLARSRAGDAPDHIKKDMSIEGGGAEFFKTLLDTDNQGIGPFNGEPARAVYFRGLQECYDHYTNTFSVLKAQRSISCTTMKIQKTAPGGGYHVFHFEQGPNEQSKRILTFILYLNTIPQDCGGETEFLYQRRRYAPIANRLIMFPAAFTHTHRGNLVLKGEPKYIITGWFCYD